MAASSIFSQARQNGSPNSLQIIPGLIEWLKTIATIGSLAALLYLAWRAGSSFTTIQRDVTEIKIMAQEARELAREAKDEQEMAKARLYALEEEAARTQGIIIGKGMREKAK